MSFSLPENHAKELAVVSVIHLPANPKKVVEFIELRGMASLETEVTLQIEIKKDADLNTFSAFSLGNNNKELIGLLNAKPGSQFNLSTVEYQKLNDMTHGSQQPTSDALKIYSEILEQRWRNYLAGGLKGIATYDRGAGKTADPASELLTASLNHSVLTLFFPELHQIWLNYPVTMPVDVSETYFLVNRLVENRPTADLVHRVISTIHEGTIILSRQFYVGHSYNSNQITIICVPYLNGTMLFYLNQTFTDQITGFGSSIKRPIGREQKRRRMETHLKTLSNALK